MLVLLFNRSGVLGLLQVGQYEYPLESVKMLWRLVATDRGYRSEAQGGMPAQGDRPAVCSHPALTDIFRPMCRDPNAGKLFADLCRSTTCGIATVMSVCTPV